MGSKPPISQGLAAAAVGAADPLLPPAPPKAAITSLGSPPALGENGSSENVSSLDTEEIELLVAYA